MAEKSLGNVLAGKLITGKSPPSNEFGLNGDSYFDTNTKIWYVKEFDAWVDSTTLGGAGNCKHIVATDEVEAQQLSLENPDIPIWYMEE